MRQPIQDGVRVQAGYTSQQPLHNKKELLQCITQGFGVNPQNYGGIGHNGLDFAYTLGTNLYAPFDAQSVVYKEEKDAQGNFKGYGKYLTFTNASMKVVYGHLQEALVTTGPVRAGQLVAHGDSTGNSTGNHLHLTLKMVDTNGDVLNRNNGYDGAVDPTPYLAFVMFELRQVAGQKDVWLVRNGKRSLVYNAGALALIADFSDISPITQAELNAIPDTGKVLAVLDQE